MQASASASEKMDSSKHRHLLTAQQQKLIESAESGAEYSYRFFMFIGNKLPRDHFIQPSIRSHTIEVSVLIDDLQLAKEQGSVYFHQRYHMWKSDVMRFKSVVKVFMDALEEHENDEINNSESPQNCSIQIDLAEWNSIVEPNLDGNLSLAMFANPSDSMAAGAS